MTDIAKSNASIADAGVAKKSIMAVYLNLGLQNETKTIMKLE